MAKIAKSSPSHQPDLHPCYAVSNFVLMAKPAQSPQVIDPLQEECGVRAALDVIRGRWKPFIMYELHMKRCRYSELQAAIPQVSSQALTKQLRELEQDGVVTRTVIGDSPVRVVYELSEFGWTLGEIMDRLEAWGIEYMKRRDPSYSPVDHTCSHKIVSS